MMFSNTLPAFDRSFVKAFAASLVSLLVLAGCFKPQARSGEDAGRPAANELSSATFFNDEVRGKAGEVKTLEGFSIPVSRLYNFTVCVKEKRTQDAVANHKFTLTGGKEEIDLESDRSGCLNWSEEIEYSFLSEEMYVPVTRYLTAKGIQTGARELKLAINPWNFSGKATDVVDLTRTKIDPKYIASKDQAAGLLKGLSAEGSRVTRQLWPKKISASGSASPSSSEKGISRRISLWVSPGVLVYGLQNQSIIYELQEAKMKVQAVLVASASVGGARSDFKVWESSDAISFTRDGDQYQASLDVSFVQASASGPMALALRISPDQGPEGLVAFEGLFEVGTLSQFSSNGTLALTMKSSNGDGKFSFDTHVKSLAAVQTSIQSPAQPQTQSQGQSQPQPSGAGNGSASSVQGRNAGSSDPSLPSGVSTLKRFQMGPLKPEWLGEAEGGTSTRRTVNYAVQTCITDTTNGGKAASDVEFTIVKPDGTKLKKRTFNVPSLEGCLRWEDKITHEYYEPEKFVLIPITIRHDATGFEEKRTIAISPYGPWGFGRDFLENPGYIESINSREEVPSRILADGFGFDTVDTREYEVDEFLSLKTIKRVRFRVGLRAQRHSSIFQGKNLAPEPIRDGVYALRAVLYTEYVNPSGEKSELISSMKGQTRLARVRGSELKFDADFPVADLQLMRARANLVFELLPIEEEKLTKEMVSSLNADRATIESLIKPVKGFVTPTFTGAMWLRDEGGGGVIVPTDDLLADVSAGVNASGSPKVRSALRPLANMTVSKLLDRMHEIEKKYKERMSNETSLAGLIKRGNVEFVSLNEEKAAASAAKDPKLAAVLQTNNRMLPVKGAADRLVQALNYKFSAFSAYGSFALPKPITKTTLLDIVEGRAQIDAPMAARLCVLLAQDLPKKMAANGEFVVQGGRVDIWARDCMKKINGQLFGYGKEPLTDLFAIERKLRVLETGGAQFVDGRGEGLSVGADVSFGRSSSSSFGYGWSPLKVLDAASKLPVPGAKFLSIPDALGISMGWSHSDSVSVGEGSGVGSGTSINMEYAVINVTVKKYEMCTVIRMNPKFWESNAKTLASNVNQKVLTGDGGQKLVDVLTRGLLLCTSNEVARPIVVQERYFSLAQGFFDETTLDRGDLRNHPWLLTMRGVGDFANFVGLLVAKKAKPAEVTEKIDVAHMPLDRLATAYKGVTPGVPGIYTIDSNLPKPKVLPSADGSY